MAPGTADARVVPPAHQTGIFGLLPTAGNVGSLIFPLAASGLASVSIAAAIGIGALSHAASAAAGVRLGRVR